MIPEGPVFSDGQQEFKWKDIIPKGFWHKCFLVLTVLEAGIVIVLSSISLHQAQQTNNQSDGYLAIIVLFGCLWFFYFSFHGIYRHNKFELFSFLIALILVTGYVIYRFIRRSLDSNLDIVQYLGLIVVGVLDACFVVVSLRLFKTFNEWRLQKMVPALVNDLDLRALHWYEAWSALLKLDVLCGIIMILMGIFFFFSTWETVVSMAGILVLFAWVFVGRIGIRLEDKKFVLFFFLFSILQPIDYIQTLVAFSSNNPQYDGLPLGQIFIAAILALVVRLSLVLVSVKLVVSFGKGLRDKVFDPEEEAEPIMSTVIDKEITPYLTLTLKKLDPRQLMHLRETNLDDIAISPEAKQNSDQITS